MASPLVFQGTLNRALTSVSVVALPYLNVTTGFFGEKVADLNFEGSASDYLPTLSGAVPSPRLFQTVTVSFYLNKSQPLAGQWEAQRLLNSSIGDVNVVTDAVTLGSYYLSNCILLNVPNLNLAGNSPDYPVIVQGTYNINSSLYS